MTSPDITEPAQPSINGGSIVTSPARSMLAMTVWREVLDELLRGVAHALSNRVATVSASAYLASGGEPLEPDMAAALSAESERLERLLADIRLLPSPVEASEEPVMLADVVTQAIDLHRHHLGLREVPVRVMNDASTPPIAVNPVVLTHVLLVMLTAVRMAARDTTSITADGRATTPEVVVTIDGNAEEARLAAAIDTVPRRAMTVALRLADACAALAESVGATATHDSPLTRIGMTFPSLAARRAATRG
jgi:hypothetical protein